MKKVRNYQIDWREDSAVVASLVLDPENIRLEAVSGSQEEIIADLFVNERTMDVFESIYDNGFFPDESPVVVVEKGQKVVLEGNRRVASLQAMLNPSITPPRFASQIEKKMRGVEPLKRISVRVAPSRADAQVYLAAKHTKNTRRPWSTLRRAYFYYAQKEKGATVKKLMDKYHGVNIPKYIKMYEMHRIATSLKGISDDIRNDVSSRRNFDISTLERLYDDHYVTSKLGISFSDTGEVTVPKTKEFEEAYERIITDIVDKIITSRKRISDAKGRKEYIDEILPSAVKKERVASADAFKPVEPKRQSRETLDMRGVVFNLPYPAVERVFNELSRINISDGNKGFPNAAHDLLRSFLECSLKAFFEVHSITVSKKNQYTFLDDALKEFEVNVDVPLLAGSKYTALRKLVGSIRQNAKILSHTSDYMNQINHNHYFFSDKEAIKTAWETIKPLFMFILATVPTPAPNTVSA